MTQLSDPLDFAPRTPRQSAITGNLLGVASMVSWAVGFPAAELLLVNWSPLALISVRYSMAAVCLLMLWISIEGPRAMTRGGWRWGIYYGGVGFGVAMWLLLVAQQTTDAVTVAIFASTMPIWATGLEMLLDGRRITVPFLIGLAATIAGGLVATGGGTAQFGVGALLVILSALVFCWGSRGTIRHLPQHSALGQAAMTMIGGMLILTMLFISAVVIGVETLPTHGPEPREIALMVLYAVVALGLSQLLWIASVGHLGVALASFHLNIAPFYVMLIMLGLGAQWSWPQAIGAAIVGFGVVISQQSGPNRKPAAEVL